MSLIVKRAICSKVQIAATIVPRRGSNFEP
jgi:hypothetical protein